MRTPITPEGKPPPPSSPPYWLDGKFGTYHPHNETWVYNGETSQVHSGPSLGWVATQPAGAGDPRVLSLGWALQACGAHSTLSILTDVRYDPRLRRLVTNPTAELASLRTGMLTTFAGAVAPG